MAKKLASGQITITDLNDGRVLSKYTNASQGYTQIYDTENKTYSVDYTKTNQVITASVFASGSDTTDKAETACDNWHWFVNEAEVSSTTAGMSANGNKLTIKKNLDSDTKTFNVKWTCTFHDDITNTTVVISDGCSINRTTSGTSAVLVQMQMERGNVFNRGMAASDKLPIKATLLRGTSLDKTDLTFTWYKLALASDGTLGWTKITSGITTTSTGESTLQVGRDDVDGSQTFKVEVYDQTLKDGTFTGFATIMDQLDEYTVVLSSPNGDVIKNGEGSVTITANVLKNNEPVTDIKNMTFTWAKYDNGGTQVVWSGTNNKTQVLTGDNRLTVQASDINVKTTIVCEVSQ